MREVAGDAARWGEVEHLLASVIDVLQDANWQRGAKKGSRRPTRYPRPGTTEADGTKTKKYGGKKKYTPAEFDRIKHRFGGREGD